MAAGRAPDDPALDDRGAQRTYAELSTRVWKLAAGLEDLGMRPGDRLAGWLPRGDDELTALLATSAAGGVYVPLHPELRAPQVRHILSDCGAEMVVTQGDRLEALARRHGVGDVIVAQAVKGATRRGLPSVRVTIRRYNQTRGDQSFEMDFPGAPGESVAGLLGRAVGAVRDGIEEMWKQDNILRFDQAMVLAVALPIRGLSDWVDAKKRLSAIAVIQGMDLVLISRDEVRINLHHIGEIEQLTLALAQADLALFEEKGGWILNFQGRAAAKRGDRSPARRTNGGA